MTRITDLLRNEHEAILKILEILDANAQKAAGGVRIEPKILDGLMRCLEDYVDPCHHRNEESILFATLEKKGVPREEGALARARADHILGRELLSKLSQVVGALKHDEAGAGEHFTEAALDYAVHLRRDVKEEGEVLFELAENVLSFEELEDLGGKLEKAGETEGCKAVFNRFYETVTYLYKQTFGSGSHWSQSFT